MGVFCGVIYNGIYNVIANSGTMPHPYDLTPFNLQADSVYFPAQCLFRVSRVCVKLAGCVITRKQDVQVEGGWYKAYLVCTSCMWCVQVVGGVCNSYGSFVYPQVFCPHGTCENYQTHFIVMELTVIIYIYNIYPLIYFLMYPITCLITF